MTRLSDRIQNAASAPKTAAVDLRMPKKIPQKISENSKMPWEDEEPKKEKPVIAKLKQEIAAIPPTPKSGRRKKPMTIRIDVEVLEFFRATGRDWQPRINAILASYVEAHKGEVE